MALTSLNGGPSLSAIDCRYLLRPEAEWTDAHRVLVSLQLTFDKWVATTSDIFLPILRLRELASSSLPFRLNLLRFLRRDLMSGVMYAGEEALMVTLRTGIVFS